MSAALLPVTVKLNPAAPDRTNYLVENGMIGYIVSKNGQPAGRVFTSHGRIPAWGIGSVHRVHHDQTGRFRGEFTVVGIAEFTPHGVVTEGHVPDKMLGHSVFK